MTVVLLLEALQFKFTTLDTVAHTFGQKTIPLYICEVCYQEGNPKSEWFPVIDQHKPLKTLSVNCEKTQCSHEQDS